MARPRTIRLDGDKEIRLYGMTAEEADLVRKLFSSKATTETLAAEKESPVEEDTFELPHPALGIHKNKLTGNWELVVIKYDDISGRSEIIERHATGPDKFFVIDKFKIKAVDYKLVM